MAAVPDAYSQLGGAPIIEEGGSRIGMEDEKAIRALEWIAENWGIILPQLTGLKG